MVQSPESSLVQDQIENEQFEFPSCVSFFMYTLETLAVGMYVMTCEYVMLSQHHVPCFFMLQYNVTKLLADWEDPHTIPSI